MDGAGGDRSARVGGQAQLGGEAGLDRRVEPGTVARGVDGSGCEAVGYDTAQDGGQAARRPDRGHVGDTAPSVHLGVRLNGQYVDPLDYLGPARLVDLIRLAPVA